MHRWTWYALGVGSGILASLAGSPVGKALRPAAKGTLKAGLLMRRDVERRTEEARAGWNDLVAEASSELDGENEEAPGVQSEDR